MINFSRNDYKFMIACHKFMIQINASRNDYKFMIVYHKFMIQIMQILWQLLSYDCKLWKLKSNWILNRAEE